jgi:hypothetical protein
MLLELARPVALLSCILSLYAVFHTAFLIPASDMHQRIYQSLELLALAAAISFVGGFIFRNEAREPGSGGTRFAGTLPMRMFFWTTSTMFILFIVSWYMESYCVFYRDIRF